MLIPGKLYRLNKRGLENVKTYGTMFLQDDKGFFSTDKDGTFLFLKSEPMENCYHGAGPSSKQIMSLYFLYKDKVGKTTDHILWMFEEVL